jgi:hypothetical protein
MKDARGRRVKDMSQDKIFVDLVTFAQEHIGKASHDALLRFRWAEYGYSEGCAGLSFVLCNLLAMVNRQIAVSPDEIAIMVKEALIECRKNDKDNDDYEES